MADNVLRKPTAHNKLSSSSADGGHHHPMPARKISAPVHRTTTETIRLGGDPIDNPGKGLHHHHGQSMSSIPLPTGNSTNNLSSAQNRTKKTSSFQITSVTVGCRMSNDAGEDSNDDLDESHTEDTSIEHSRVTDIETPSYSEDTFSKDDVFFNTSNAALSTAPVIPTSSQYGLAIVPNEGSNVNNSTNDSNINTLDIASVTENNIINQDTDLRDVHSHGTKERFKVVKIESTEPFKRGRWTCMDYLDQPSVNAPTAINTKVSDPNEVCISYGVTDTGIVVPDSKQDDSNNIVIDTNGPIHPEVQQLNSGYPVQQQQQQVSQPQYYQNSTQPEQQSQQSTQGATLPSNLHSTHQTNLAQPQSMPQGAIPILTQQGCPVTQASNTVPQQPQPAQSISHPKGDETSTTASYVPVSSQNMPSQVPPASVLVAQSQPQQPSKTSQQIQEPGIQGMQQQSIHTVSQPGTAPPAQQQQQQPQPQQPQQSQQPQQLSQSQVMPPNGLHTTSPQQQQQQQQQQPTTGNQPSAQGVPMVGAIPRKFQSDQEQDSMMSTMLGGTSGTPFVADAALLESLAEVTQTIEDQSVASETMSGTGTVAIDNKIEQAMDLVKSHLMFAVREEVEVLKEKIAELMDRINQLEAENTILKASATVETLNQLPQAVSTALAKLQVPNNSTGGQ